MKSFVLIAMAVCVTVCTTAQSVFDSDTNVISSDTALVQNITDTLNFSGLNTQPVNNYLKVSWRVADEFAAGVYNIERSSNGNIFESVGSLHAQKREVYSFIDPSPLNGNSFYRIAFTEKSGHKTYSPVIQSAFIIKDALKAQAMNGRITGTLDLKEPGNYQIAVVNFNGQAVYKDDIKYDGHKNTFEVQISNQWPMGIYSVMLHGNNVRLSCQVLIK